MIVDLHKTIIVVDECWLAHDIAARRFGLSTSLESWRWLTELSTGRAGETFIYVGLLLFKVLFAVVHIAVNSIALEQPEAEFLYIHYSVTASLLILKYADFN